MMFNEKYGLQRAVLSRTKTKTRRDGKKVEKQYAIYVVANEMKGKEDYLSLEEFAISKSPYNVGDIVAIQQSYKELLEEEYMPTSIENEVIIMVEQNHIGCTNKMYVKAELMPHHVRITEVRFEQLKCISDEECLEEGIYRRDDVIDCNMNPVVRYQYYGTPEMFATPRDAFASLIDKTCGKGTWDRNGYVYVYGIERVD
ncbi:hypothetical protein SAMN04487900_11078 [Prevotella communis]|uniref:Uncharacterized protein n=2 Tax=Prevotella communis TaxID=2913614 RepID=A0A1H0H1V3_9BACT|nr:hypothetical protein SAMN04487900_11078 [Prevotella communis]